MPVNCETVTSAEWIVGLLRSAQRTVVADVHAVVSHWMVSMRALGVLSLWPKLRPCTVTWPFIERPLLSTPR